MMEYLNIHHVSIAVRDLTRAKQFYSEVLQLQELTRPPFQSKGAWYAIGDQQLHLIECPDGEALREGPINSQDSHFAVWVKSYRDTIAWLEQAGIPYEARPESVAGFSQIYILDVDHHIIEFDAAYHS
ncbi:glyoxalase [Paenibacillus selenitireducens]|uniref:Glyoxalase n=1 Tax=Paenibacillus selenitireducens TaxID=1324314 RepID=A0A1T2XCY3_9BACL|nr:VOC family protein [Paenibacillus selenitireducens]OPA77774.1 glyoxalase [Paenibacillus selenitireducens]